jgi:hypothetical protein
MTNKKVLESCRWSLVLTVAHFQDLQAIRFILDLRDLTSYSGLGLESHRNSLRLDPDNLPSDLDIFCPVWMWNGQ